MFKVETLNALKDEELQGIIGHAQTLLKTRKEERENEALEKAAEAMRAAGRNVNMRELRSMAKRGNGNGRSPYKAGTHYQHPDDKSLVWNAKGQKPNWIRDLESAGKGPIEVTA